MGAFLANKTSTSQKLLGKESDLITEQRADNSFSINRPPLEPYSSTSPFHKYDNTPFQSSPKNVFLNDLNPRMRYSHAHQQAHSPNVLSNEQFSQNIILPQGYIPSDHIRSRVHYSTNTAVFQHQYNQAVPSPQDLQDQYYYLFNHQIPQEKLETFPSTFDPKSAPNMPHKEKVNRWIKDVPVYVLSNMVDGVEVWQTDCYPGVIPSSSTASESEMDNSPYANDLNELFIDQEDMLEFQARKITYYVNKLYHSKHPETTGTRGEDTQTSMLQGIDSGVSKDYINVLNPNMTTGSYNLNLTEAYEQELNQEGHNIDLSFFEDGLAAEERLTLKLEENHNVYG